MDILRAEHSSSLTGGPSFSIGNRLYRAAWCTVWTLLAAWTPSMFHGWRRFLLGLFGARLAPTSVVYSSARIWSPAMLTMGDHACIGPRVTVYSMAQITLESYAIVSQGAHLCTGTHDIEDIHFQLKARPITIGTRAWIAADAFVGPGVTVGQGAVLGARGMAFRDLDPWMVYVGNPCRHLRARAIRFPDAHGLPQRETDAVDDV